MAGRVSPDRVCLGVMVGAHGVRGLVKVKTFTEDPADVAAYGPVSDEAGRRQWRLDLVGPAPGKSGDVMLARLEGVTDRDAAQALHGVRLYVERAALPEPEDAEAFYHADLIGLRVEDAGGRLLGRVKAVENHGAGDLLEVEAAPGEGGGRTLLLPFTRQVVPLVDLAGGRLVAAPPAEVEVPAGPGETGPEEPEES
jgi:16S rRNA processing protein RimM